MAKYGKVHLWFRHFTSIGGLTQVRDSDNRVSERCWLLIFVVGIILTCVSLQNTLSEFFNFGVNIAVNMTQWHELEFPAVTICNSNPVHCGNLAIKIQECERNQTCPRLIPLCDLYFFGYCNISNEISSQFTFGYSAIKLCKGISNATLGPQTSDPKKEFAQKYLKLTREEILFVAHQPKDMFKNCNFQTLTPDLAGQCSSLINNTVMKIFTPDIGVCYMFNFIGQSTTTGVKVRSSGTDSSLTLDINLECQHYMRVNPVTTSDGVIIVIHNSTQPPDLKSRAIHVPPHTEVKIGIAAKAMSRQPPPYVSSCTDSYPSGANITSFLYSDTYCQQDCMSKLVFSACSCWDPFLVTEKLDFDPASTNYCFSDTDSACVRQLMMKGAGSQCKCAASCYESRYVPEISHRQWPTQASWGAVAQNYMVKYNNKTVEFMRSFDFEIASATGTLESLNMSKTGSAVRDYVYNNFARVQIFYNSMALEVMSEEKQYTFLTLLTSLGGDLSFYVGITVLSFIEIFEYLLRLVFSLFKKQKK